MIQRAASGRFFDGKSGTPHDVVIQITGSHLTLNALDGKTLKRWSFNEIQVLEKASPPQPAKLTSKREPDARLLVSSEEDWEKIRGKLPKDSFSFTLPTSFVHFIGYIAASVAIIIAACFYFPRALESGSVLIPQSLEKRLGNYVISSIIEKPVCIAKPGHAALDKIIKAMAKGAGSDINYKIYVVDDAEIVNAVSAPGGYIVLFRGAIDKMGSAGEVAGVLAHEMAHLELDHPMRSLARDVGSSLMIQAMLGGQGDTARLVALLSQMSYSRQDENAADRKGQEILAATGYDPQYMTKFFERLLDDEKKEEGGLTDYGHTWVYLSTHPLTADRIRDLKANKLALQKPLAVLSGSEWNDLRHICSKYEDYNPDK